MIRRWPVIAVCAVLGIATTIASAWLLATLRPRSVPMTGMIFLDRDNEPWIGFGEDGFGWQRMTMYGAEAVTAYGRTFATGLPRWFDGSAAASRPAASRAITSIGAGWPLVSLHAQRSGIGHDDPPPGSTTLFTGMGPQWVEWSGWRNAIGDGDALKPATPTDRVLPLGVAWPGFIVNSALFAMVWSLPMWYTALRRASRRRRGCCPMCGYDIRGVTDRPCTECGVTPVTSPN